MSNHKLLPTILEEGYCCLYGFLAIERERGQTPQSLAQYWGFEASNFRHHYAQLDARKRTHRCPVGEGCSRNPICMQADITSLQSERKK